MNQSTQYRTQAAVKCTALLTNSIYFPLFKKIRVRATDFCNVYVYGETVEDERTG